MHLKNRISVTTKYTKIATETCISILLEFNCVPQFDTCCTDWDKATVKFVARSDDILIYALQKWDQWVFVLDQWVFVLDHKVFVLDHRVFVFDQWVFVLDQWVFVLDHKVFVLVHRVFVLDQWVFVLDHRVFGLRSSFLGLRFRHIRANAKNFLKWRRRRCLCHYFKLIFLG